MTHKRPISLTIICWLLIVGAFLSLFSLLGSLDDPAMRAASRLPVGLQLLMGIVSSAVSLVSVIGMLEGIRAARTFYVGWGILNWVVSLATTPNDLLAPVLLIGLPIFGLILACLYSAKANAFFAQGESDDEVTEELTDELPAT